jgi:hypothetical protein
LGRVGFEQTPVVVLQVPTPWHWSDAVQVIGFAPVHVPPWQVSVCVQALPSLQGGVPGLGCATQASVASLQMPSLHWLPLAEQSRAAPGAQVPAWHASPTVQNAPSLHGVLFGFAGSEHSPVPGLHVPASWHWSEAVQTFGDP